MFGTQLNNITSSSSGGSSDWTDAEKAIIRFVYGIPGEQTPVTSGMILDIQNRTNQNQVNIDSLIERLTESRAQNLDHLNRDLSTIATKSDLNTARAQIVAAGNLDTINQSIAVLLDRVTETRLNNLDNLDIPLSQVGEAVWHYDVEASLANPGEAREFLRRLDVNVTTRANAFQVSNELDWLLTNYNLNLAWPGIELLLERLTDARVSYLDNLNVGGPVVTQDGISGIQNNTRTAIAIPTTYVLPETGSVRFIAFLNNFTASGNQQNLSSAPVVEITTPQGTVLGNSTYIVESGGTHTTQMSQVSGETGRYFIYIEVDSDQAPGSYNIKFTVEDGEGTRFLDRNLLLLDQPNASFSQSDRNLLESLIAVKPDNKIWTDSSGRIDIGRVLGSNIAAQGLFDVSSYYEANSRLPAEMVLVDASVRNALVDSIWDEPLSSHSGTGTTGRGLIDATSAANLDLDSIASAVWSEPLAGYTTIGAAGNSLSLASEVASFDLEAIADAVWSEDMAEHTTAGSAGGFLTNQVAGTTGAVNELLNTALEDFFTKDLGITLTSVTNNSWASLLSRVFRIRPGGDFLQVKMSHLVPQDASWHIQIQMTSMNDPSFGSPLVTYDSTQNRSNLFYTYTDVDNEQTIIPFPSGGIFADTSEINDDFLFAKAWVFLDRTRQIEIINLNNVLVRARQSSDQGSTWGNWSVEDLRIG